MRNLAQLTLAIVGTASAVTFAIIIILSSYEKGKARLVNTFAPLILSERHTQRTDAWTTHTTLAKAAATLFFIFLWLAFKQGFSVALWWVPKGIGYRDEDGFFFEYVKIISFTVSFIVSCCVFNQMAESLK